MARELCWVCDGDGVVDSGRDCICGGSGLHVDEVAGLRAALYDLRIKHEELKRDLSIANEEIYYSNCTIGMIEDNLEDARAEIRSLNESLGSFTGYYPPR